MEKVKIKVLSGDESLVGKELTLLSNGDAYKIEDTFFKLVDIDEDIQFAFANDYIGVEVEAKGMFVIEDNLKYIDSFIILK